MTLPLPQDDPRQVRALEAATELWCEGMHDTFSPRAKIIAGHSLAAYFSALQSEGVVLVAAPPCKACEGSGRYRDPRYWGTMPGSTACPRCDGSRLARMVALDDVVEFIADGDFKAGNKLMAVAVERRFSGTGEEPHG